MPGGLGRALLGSGASDVYDAEGNTVSPGGLSYVYDFEDHLVQQGGATFVYDGGRPRRTQKPGPL